MTKKKTIREWLEELPEPYRAKALSNFAKEEKDRQENTASSLGIALAGAFAWGKTSEGWEYWNDLCNSLCKIISCA